MDETVINLYPTSLMACASILTTVGLEEGRKGRWEM